MDRPDPRVPTSKKASEWLARGITLFTFAPVLSVPAFLLLIAGYAPRGQQAEAWGIAFFFGGLIPILVVVAWSYLAGEDWDFPHRERRTGPMLAVTGIYSVGFLLLEGLQVPFWIALLMAAYALNTGIVTLVNTRWKVSVHSTGVMGPATVLAWAMGIPGILMAALLPLVVWSRWHLRKHTPAQLLAGALIGLLATLAQILLSLWVGVPM